MGFVECASKVGYAKDSIRRDYILCAEGFCHQANHGNTVVLCKTVITVEIPHSSVQNHTGVNLVHHGVEGFVQQPCAIAAVEKLPAANFNVIVEGAACVIGR